MATYDFHCHKCNKVFEINKRMTEVQEFESCPMCGRLSKRVFMNTPVIFNTSGFYCTDNKKER